MRSNQIAADLDKELNEFEPKFVSKEANDFVRMCQQYRKDYKLFKNEHDKVMLFILKLFKKMHDNESGSLPSDHIVSSSNTLPVMLDALTQYLQEYHPNSKKLNKLLIAYKENNRNLAADVALERTNDAGAWFNTDCRNATGCFHTMSMKNIADFDSDVQLLLDELKHGKYGSANVTTHKPS